MLTRRRALGHLAWPLAALAGCAGKERQWQPVARGELLTPRAAITGGRAVGAGNTATPGGERLRLERPVAVAARGDVLVIADAGARTLWRYDRKRDTLQPLAPFTIGADGRASMQLDPDMRTWLALPAEQAVDQFDAQGRLLRRWRSDAEMPFPVAVLWREEEGDAVVADGTTFQIVSLDRRGSVQRMPMAEALPLRSVADLAQGPRGLYVLDRVAQQIVTVGSKGEPGETIGHGYLVMPRALAADGKGRVYVADELDQRIYVFRGPKLIGRARGSFGRIESMALDGDMLYVADSLLGRVHALQVVPASQEEEQMR